MRRSAFRNAADFGVLRPAARRCRACRSSSLEPETSNPPPRNFSSAAILFGRSPSFGRPTMAEDIGDPPFELARRRWRRPPMFESAHARAVSPSTPRACSWSMPSRNCSACLRQRLSDQELQRRKVRPLEQPLRTDFIALLLPAPGVRALVGI